MSERSKKNFNWFLIVIFFSESLNAISKEELSEAFRCKVALSHEYIQIKAYRSKFSHRDILN
jgi:hypothetical protein